MNYYQSVFALSGCVYHIYIYKQDDVKFYREMEKKMETII